MAPSSSKKWLPLESNPEVIASFAHTLGLPADVGFHDIFGFDPDLLAMVPQPVHAVLLLFPITDASERARAEMREEQARADADFERRASALRLKEEASERRMPLPTWA